MSTTPQQTLKELFEDIINKLGPYSSDHHKHAENVIDTASLNAGKIKNRLIDTVRGMIKEAENGEIADVKVGLYALAKDLGEKVVYDSMGEPYFESAKQ